ncbi:MAG: hypothetical protein L3J38_07520, partial [Thiomicrorhabdus sp.]|nr:hypothetical protein [Thiomicrorhabdus sp.]
FLKVRPNYIPKLIGNAGILGLAEITRQSAVCREWLAIRNNCNAVLWFSGRVKKLHFQVVWV